MTIQHLRWLTSVIILSCLCIVVGCETLPKELTTIGIRKRLNISKTESKVKQIQNNINKIAVFSTPKEYSHHIEGHFMEYLLNKGYEVVSRLDLPVVMQEISLQHSGITAGEAANFGQILKTDAVILVEITEFEKRRTDNGDYSISKLSMTARLIIVESSKVIWISSKSYNPSLLEGILKLPTRILFSGENELDSLSNSILEEFPIKN